MPEISHEIANRQQVDISSSNENCGEHNKCSNVSNSTVHVRSTMIRGVIRYVWSYASLLLSVDLSLA